MTTTLGLYVEASPSQNRSNKQDVDNRDDYGFGVDSDEINDVAQLKEVMSYVYDPKSDSTLAKRHKFYGNTIHSQADDRLTYQDTNDENVNHVNHNNRFLSTDTTKNSRSRSDSSQTSTINTHQTHASINTSNEFMRYLSSKYGSPDDVNVQLDIDRTDLERIEGHYNKFPENAMGIRWFSVIVSKFIVSI